MGEFIGVLPKIQLERASVGMRHFKLQVRKKSFHIMCFRASKTRLMEGKKGMKRDEGIFVV